MTSTIFLGERVFFSARDGQGERPGTCVGRACARGRWHYDVEDDQGHLWLDVASARLAQDGRNAA